MADRREVLLEAAYKLLKQYQIEHENSYDDMMVDYEVYYDNAMNNGHMLMNDIEAELFSDG